MPSHRRVRSTFELEGLGTRYAIHVEAPFSVKHASSAEAWPALLCLDVDGVARAEAFEFERGTDATVGRHR